MTPSHRRWPSTKCFIIYLPVINVASKVSSCIWRAPDFTHKESDRTKEQIENPLIHHLVDWTKELNYPEIQQAMMRHSIRNREKYGGKRRQLISSKSMVSNLWVLPVVVVLIFFSSSLVLHKELSQVDDNINNSKRPHDDWTSLSSMSSGQRQRKLAVAVERTTSGGRSSGSSAVGNNDDSNVKAFVQLLRNHDFEQRQNKRSDISYDIYNCPENPPKGYPMAWNVLDVLENWPADDTDLPGARLSHSSLCVFDWDTEKEKAEKYREMELPFVVNNHPGVFNTANNWNTPGYLDKLLTKPERAEHGESNHLMFWRTASPAEYRRFPQEAAIPPGWKPPTDMVELSYKEWLDKAMDLEERTKDHTKQEHFYFRLNAYGHINPFLYEELPFFDPSKHEDFVASADPNAFLMVHADQHRGINCRFGQRGTIAESHFDSSSNFVVLLGGQRRYILAHPDQCKNMELYPQLHPSGRHSRINWSTAVQELRNSSTPFAKAQVNEVVLQAGDLMYLPTYWFHFIVSLNINYQCNSRSGVSLENQHFISECGFQ